MKIDFADAYGMDDNDYSDDELKDNSSKTKKNNDEDPPHVFCRPRISLPVYEGEVSVGFSRECLKYHVGMCYFDSRDEQAFVNLALKTCQIACIAADISRGRPISPAMSQLLTKSCITKLTNMWKLMDEYFTDNNDSETRSAVRSFPAVPSLFNGMLVSPNHFEGVVRICAGPVKYWASLSLELKNNRWICTYADLG